MNASRVILSMMDDPNVLVALGQCPACGGSGTVADETTPGVGVYVECEKCNGWGQVVIAVETAEGDE